MLPNSIRSRSVVALLLALLTPGRALGVTPSGAARDVTDTPAGRTAAAEAAARFGELGVSADAAALVVLDFGAGDLLIGPRGTDVLSYSVTAIGFEVSVLPPPGEPSDPRNVTSAHDATSGGLGVAAGPYWQLANSFCWERRSFHNGTIWMDTCYHKHRLINDGSSTYDYFEMHMFATGASVGKTKTDRLTISAWRASGSAAQTWFDWHPRSDVSNRCQSFAVGVAEPVPIAYTHQQCDLWDMTKHTDAGHYTQAYVSPFFGAPINSEREVAFDVSVRVAQGATAMWVFQWSGTSKT